MSAQKQILLISYYFPPFGLGGVQRAVKLAKYLPDFGWNVVVLTVKEVSYYNKDFSLLEEIESSEIRRTSSLDPLRLFYLLSRSKETVKNNMYPGKTNRLLKFLEKIILIPDSKILWNIFAYSHACRLIKERNIRAVISTAPPFSSHLLAVRLQRKFNIPVITDFRDGWTNNDFIPAAGKFNTAIHSRLERKIIKNAAGFTAISQKILSHLNSISGDSDKGKLIYNGYDSVDFPQEDELPGDFIIAFMGAVTRWADPSVFFDAIRTALKKEQALQKKLKINIVGALLLKDFKENIKEYELDSYFSFFGYLPHKSALSEIMKSSMLMFPVTAGNGAGLITGKIFEYLASGKPILAHVPNGEAHDILSKYHQETFFLAGKNKNEAADFIIHQFRAWNKRAIQRRTSVTRPSDNPSLEMFTRKYQAEQFADLLNSFV